MRIRKLLKNNKKIKFNRKKAAALGLAFAMMISSAYANKGVVFATSETGSGDTTTEADSEEEETTEEGSFGMSGTVVKDKKGRYIIWEWRRASSDMDSFFTQVEQAAAAGYGVFPCLFAARNNKDEVQGFLSSYADTSHIKLRDRCSYPLDNGISEYDNRYKAIEPTKMDENTFAYFLNDLCVVNSNINLVYGFNEYLSDYLLQDADGQQIREYRFNSDRFYTDNGTMGALWVKPENKTTASNSYKSGWHWDWKDIYDAGWYNDTIKNDVVGLQAALILSGEDGKDNRDYGGPKRMDSDGNIARTITNLEESGSTSDTSDDSQSNSLSDLFGETKYAEEDGAGVSVGSKVGGVAIANKLGGKNVTISSNGTSTTIVSTPSTTFPGVLDSFQLYARAHKDSTDGGKGEPWLEIQHLDRSDESKFTIVPYGWLWGSNNGQFLIESFFLNHTNNSTDMDEASFLCLRNGVIAPFALTEEKCGNTSFKSPSVTGLCCKYDMYIGFPHILSSMDGKNGITTVSDNENYIVKDATYVDEQGIERSSEGVILPEGNKIVIEEGGTLSIEGNFINNGQIINKGGTIIVKKGGCISTFSKYIEGGVIKCQAADSDSHRPGDLVIMPGGCVACLNPFDQASNRSLKYKLELSGGSTVINYGEFAISYGKIATGCTVDTRKDGKTYIGYGISDVGMLVYQEIINRGSLRACITEMDTKYVVKRMDPSWYAELYGNSNDWTDELWNYIVDDHNQVVAWAGSFGIVGADGNVVQFVKDKSAKVEAYYGEYSEIEEQKRGKFDIKEREY